MGSQGRRFGCHGLLDALNLLDELLKFAVGVSEKQVAGNNPRKSQFPCLGRVRRRTDHAPSFAHSLVRLVNHALQLELCAALARLARC